MKKFVLLGTLAVFGLASLPALAAVKTYQVTGPVLELGADKIVVQKGKEKWEIATGSAAVPADVKVGSKVMIEYSMTAATITSKDAPAAPAKDKKEKAAKPASTPAPVVAPAMKK